MKKAIAFLLALLLLSMLFVGCDSGGIGGIPTPSTRQTEHLTDHTEHVTESVTEYDDTCPECSGAGKITCTVCNGTGKTSGGYKCFVCMGSGIQTCWKCDGSGHVAQVNTETPAWPLPTIDPGPIQGRTCPRCGGTGKVTCPSCGGRGYLIRTRFSGNTMYEEHVRCYACNSTGLYMCTGCSGTGKIY